MKVIMINGSTRKNGCTYTALSEIAKILNDEGIETEILQMGGKSIRDCIGCGGCVGKGHCVFNDDTVNEWIDKAKEADGFIFGTPVYFAHPSGQIQSLLDRMFCAGGENFTHKPSAVITSARRGGTTASLDTLNKYFGIQQMPIITSTYWNMVHGNTPDEVRQDSEGMQTMRNLGRNMAWFLKCVEASRHQGVEVPDAESDNWTNFIRQDKR